MSLCKESISVEFFVDQYQEVLKNFLNPLEILDHMPEFSLHYESKQMIIKCFYSLYFRSKIPVSGFFLLQYIFIAWQNSSSQVVSSVILNHLLCYTGFKNNNSSLLFTSCYHVVSPLSKVELTLSGTLG